MTETLDGTMQVGERSAAAGQIIELLRRNAMASGAAPVLLAPDHRPLTHDELLEAIEHAARTLRAAGVGAKDRVAVIASNGPGMVVLFLAVAAIAGCAPLNPAYTATEFEFYLQDLRPRLLLIESGISASASAVAAKLGIETIEITASADAAGGLRFVGAPAAAADVEFATPDETALLLHTSGTTSRPKLVPLTQRNLCGSAFNIARSLALSPSDRCLAVMPLFHIHGLVGAALSTIASGGSLACAGAFRPAEFFGWLETFEPTWYTAVPSMHAAVLARADRRGPAPRSHRLRFIRSCSAPLPPAVAAGLENFFAVPVIEAYGMTEAAHQMACNPLPPGRRQQGSVGIATGTEIGIMDPAGTLLSPGIDGEIVVRGANVMRGYVAAAEVNTTAFSGGWFRTGDQGRLDEDGYLFVTGRIKEIINRGGEKISPREIDEALLAHPAVAEAVAFALPDRQLGEEIGAAVVPKPEAEGLDARSLLAFAAARLAPFKLPRRIVFLGEIPKGPTGKPQRIGLAQRLGLEEQTIPAAAAAASMGPCSPTELTLMQLCREAFRLEAIGIHDNFFECGGDSIASLSLLFEIERHWEISVTVADLLAAPTIAQLAALIDEATPDREAPDLAIIQAGGARPPFFCLGAGPRYRHLAHLLGPEQPFLGPLHPHPSRVPNPCRIEDIAAHHLGVIRRTQPHGPYFLGGWCIDGLVAYEVAQQLSASGERIGLLVLFDTGFYSSSVVAIGERLRSSAAAIAARLQTAKRRAAANELPGWLYRRAARLTKQAGNKIIGRRQAAHERDGGGWLETAVQQRAASAYRPAPCEGPVILLQSSSQRGRRARARQDWSGLARAEYQVVDLPGDHEGIFEMPHVRATAEKLAAALRAAQAAASNECAG